MGTIGSKLLTILLIATLLILPAPPAVLASSNRPSTPAAPLSAPLLQPLNPPPAGAQSTGLPASAITNLRQQWGGRHTLGTGFDGSFSRLSTTVHSFGDSYTMPTNTSLIGFETTTVIVVPPGPGRDILQFDMSLTNNGIYGSGATLSIRPQGATTWPTLEDQETVFDGPSAPLGGPPATATGTGLRVSLGNSVPDTAAMEIRLRCYTDNSSGTCTWSNLSIIDSAPGWRLLASEPTDWWLHRTTATTFAGISPTVERGSFFTIQVRETGSGARLSSSQRYRGPSLTLPQFTSTDVLTASLWWARTLDDPTPFLEGGSGATELSFAPADGSTALTFASIPATTTLDPTPWTRLQSNPLPASLAGKAGWVDIRKQLGGIDHTVAIDEIVFYLNGQPLTGANLPLDQGVGKCTCSATGTVQIIDGDPVNTASGSFYHQATDLSLASSGPPLTFVRTYVSLYRALATPITTLGPGWRHSFAHALTLPGQPGGEPGRVIYEVPTGNRLRFSDRVGDGVLGAGVGVRGTLNRAGSTYTLTLRDQTTLRFDGQGRLIEQRNPEGHVQQLTYFATPGQIQDGQLQQVTDATSQRRLSFAYISVGGQPRVQAVTDSAGRSVTYSYTANGELESAVDLRTTRTVYSYSGTPRLMTSITMRDSNNAILLNTATVTYDTSTPPRVSEQVDATGMRTTFTYATGTGGSRSVTVTRQKTGTPPETRIDHYRADGSLEWIEQAGQLRAYVTFDATLAPTTVVDGNGNAQQFTTNAVGLPLTLRSATSLATTFVYNADNRPSQVTSPDQTTTSFTYDGAGNATRLTIAGAGGLQSTSVYTYTGSNRLSDQRAPDGVVTRFEYDLLGQVTRATVGHGTASAQITEYQYDAVGRVVTTTLAVGTPAQRRQVTQYNADNTVARTITNYSGNGSYSAASPDVNVTTTYGYDRLGRLISVQDTFGRYVRVMSYNTAGQLTWEVANPRDSNGNPVVPTAQPSYSPTRPDANVVTQYGYDGLNRTSLITQTGILTGTFNTTTRQFSAATQRVTSLTYDAWSRPTTVTLNYVAGAPVDSSADVNLRLITYYDGRGNTTWQRDTLGRWTKTDYDADNKPIRSTQNYSDGDPLTGSSDTDLVTVVQYDAAGRTRQLIDNYANGVFSTTEPITDRIQLIEYDSLSRVTSVTQNQASASGPDLNRVTLTSYDATSTRLVGQRDPLGRWTSLGYDELGRVTSTTDNCLTASGTATATGCAAYNPASPDRNLLTRLSFDSLGRAVEAVDSLGVAARLSFDGADRARTLVQNFVAGGPSNSTTNVSSQLVYDGVGRTVEAIDPTNARETYGYNGLDQRIRLTDAVNRISEYGFDGTGTLRWTRTPDGRFAVFRVDGIGRLTTTIVNYNNGVVDGDPSDRDLITRTDYDAGGRAIRFTDSAGRITTYSYDQRDLLLSVTENTASGTCALAPCNVRTQYGYDRAGNLVQVIDARGLQVQSRSYNAADELIAVRDGLNRSTGYSYDGGGRVIGKVDPRGSAFNITYSYDAVDRLTGITAGNPANLSPIALAYNGRGERTSLADGTGTTTFQYDPLGRITQVSAPQTGTVGYGYNGRGDRTQLNYPGTGAPVISFTYFADRQLQSIAQGGTSLATYIYDSVGRLSQLRRRDGTPGTTNYTYDGADRLTDVRTVKGSTTLARTQYTLNRLGLRTQVVETLGSTRTIAYGYDGLNRLISAAESGATTNTHGYGFDLAGNRTSITTNGSTQSFSFDAANQRTDATYDAAGNLTATTNSSASFDALNRMVGSTNGGTTATNRFNGDGVLVESTSNGATTRIAQDLAAPLDQILTLTSSSSTAHYVYGHERILATGTGGRLWYATDGLGSVRRPLDDNGTPLGSINYNPLGRIQSGSVPTFGFAGELQDQATSLVYLRARWYTPNSGVFVSPDPFPGVVERPSSLHPYQYAFNNPTLHRDPSGRFPPVLIAVGIGALIGGGLEYGSQVYQNYQQYGWQGGRTFVPTNGWAIAQGVTMGALAGGVGFFAGPAAANLPWVARMGSPLLRSMVAGGLEGMLSSGVAQVGTNLIFGCDPFANLQQALFGGLISGGIGGGIGWRVTQASATITARLRLFSLDAPPATTRAVRDYLEGVRITAPNGTRYPYGASVRGVDLRNMTADEIDLLMRARGFTRHDDVIRDPVTKEPALDSANNTAPMIVYTHPDGGMVRVKPQGDPANRFRPQPHVSMSVRNPPDASYQNFDLEAFKVSNDGIPLPKYPRDAFNPYGSSSPEGRAYMDALMNMAHTDLP